jgi:hypothetical protein
MTATNETTNYKLPLFIDNDQPTWLGDFNGAMNKIDSGITTVGANASTALSAANNAVNRVGQVETTIAAVQTTANNAYSLSTTNASDIGTLDGQVAKLESKFPITADSLANGAVTAPKLDQTAIAAMWAGLTVKRFDSEDTTADNEGMYVPSGGIMAGFYIVELGLLVLNKMNNTYNGDKSAIFTLPQYVPNNAKTGFPVSACFFISDQTTDFISWTSLQTIKSTRQIGIATPPSAGKKFSLSGSVVLFTGINTGVAASSLDAYQRMNPTVG